MSTSSNIAYYDTETSLIHCVYCHSDGYPSWNGKILLENYNDDDKIKELISFGDMSSLNKNIHPTGPHTFNYNNREEGVCVFYGRDRGYSDVEAKIFTNEEDFLKYGDNDYTYYYKDSVWLFKHYKGNFKPLTTKEIEED